MSVVFALLAKGAFFDVIGGVDSKKVSFAPLASSRSPPSFHKNVVSDLWLITFAISRTITETTSFSPQMRYFHILYFYTKCCRPTLLELARQPVFVPFGKLQNFNYLHHLNNHFLNLSLVVTSKYALFFIRNLPQGLVLKVPYL